MPPKANKIATAIAAVNRAVVRNVKAANRAVVKNYNAANRAINRAPAWVKWTIAAIAVAIIGYALWKVFFAGKKEGFYETDVNKIQWVKQDKSKLTINAMKNYNITNFIDNNTSHLPFDHGVEGAEKNKHVKGVIDMEKTTGTDSVFYGNMTVEQANYWCGRSNLCGGWQGEMINGLYGVRFLGRNLELSNGNTVASDVHVIFKKGPVQTAAGDPGAGTDASLQPPNIKWGTDFRSLDTNQYMVYWRDTQVSGTNNKIMTIKSDQKGNAAKAINDLETAEGEPNILVFRGDGTYWLRKAVSKDDFRGAVIKDMWNPGDTKPFDQFVTVIKKGTNLKFNTFKELEDKTKEGPTVVTDPIVVDPGYGTTFYEDITNEMLWSEHSLMITDNVTKDACRAKVLANKSARGGSWQAYSATDSNGRCREISWECLVNRENGTSIKDGNKKCTSMEASRRSRTDNTVTWVKSNATNVLEKREILPDIPMPEDEANTGTQGTTRTEFDKAKDNFSNNKTYFESDPSNANYILSGRDVRFAANMGVSAYKPYGEIPKSFELCFNTFKISGSSVMVYRQFDGHCWFKNPTKKEDFVGADLITPVLNTRDSYTTIISKSLGFSTEQDVINKAAENPAQPEVEPVNTAYNKIHIHNMPVITSTQKINKDNLITLKECVTQGYSPLKSQGIIAHDTGSQIATDKAYNCWWVNFEDKGSLKDVEVKASDDNRDDKVLIFQNRGAVVDPGVTNADTFKTWLDKKKPVNLETDEFYIKNKDGKYLFAKNDFASKFVFTDDGNKNIFKFRNNVFSSNDQTLGLRADAINSTQYVLVWGEYKSASNPGGWTGFTKAQFEPAGVDQYKISMTTDDNVTTIPLFTGLTNENEIIILAHQSAKPWAEVFTLEKV